MQTRSAAPKLDDNGRATFRYDRGDSIRWAQARPETEKYNMLLNAPGWYLVDGKDKEDADAAKAAQAAATQHRENEQRAMTRRSLSTMDGYTSGNADAVAELQAQLAEVMARLEQTEQESTTGTGAKRGRPSNDAKLAKEAVARAEAAEAALAELRAQLEKSEGDSTDENTEK